MVQGLLNAALVANIQTVNTLISYLLSLISYLLSLISYLLSLISGAALPAFAIIVRC